MPILKSDGMLWNKQHWRICARLRRFFVILNFQPRQAALESGAFEDAIADLEAWCDAELLDADTDLSLDNAHILGDVDTVRTLISQERKRTEERAQKKRQIDKILKKADELAKRGATEGGESVLEAKHRLQDKLAAIEAAADARAHALILAQEQAETFDAKAHALLAWLDKKDEVLKAAARNPNVEAAISQIEDVLKDLHAEEGRKDATLAAGAAIQEKAHPFAEQPMRQWSRTISARWKEVNSRALEKIGELKERKMAADAEEKQLKDIHNFVKKKRAELAELMSSPMPEDLSTLDEMISGYEVLAADLQEKQSEVDQAVTNGKKSKNPAALQLGDEWKDLWVDALGYKTSLDEAKDLLEEMKRLENWDWEDWKERYCEWNDHAKARVNDLFRRIDRTATGNIPRQAFIDAIISSKFPTSRLEMEKVAALFEKDGFINAKDFINALRFDKSRRSEPKSESERIAVEMERQIRVCSCCQPFTIEKIGEGKYKFGDGQIKRMVRILRSTVMVRVGGGWDPLDVFLEKHDPCRAEGRRNRDIYKDVKPIYATDNMYAFTKNRMRKASEEEQAAPPASNVAGVIMKIREKTERSQPMFPGTSASSSLTRTRAPSDVSLGRGWPSQSPAGSQVSLSGSRPPSRSGDCTERQTRIPSLRGRKGVRYTPAHGS